MCYLRDCNISEQMMLALHLPVPELLISALHMLRRCEHYNNNNNELN